MTKLFLRLQLQYLDKNILEVNSKLEKNKSPGLNNIEFDFCELSRYS